MKRNCTFCLCCAALAALAALNAAGTALAQTGFLLINEIDPDQPGSDTLEFVELISDPANMSLRGVVVVFFNGATDTSYAAFDLDGYQTAVGLSGSDPGYFLLGNPTVVATAGGDISFPSGTLQNGPDAVALYAANAADFPNGTAVTSTNLIDAVLYGGTDAGLLAGLGVTQSFIPSDSNVMTGSISRVPPGSFDSWQFTTLVDPYASQVPKNTEVPGDYNDDGFVDAADFTVWRDHLGASDESGIHFGGDGGGVTPSDYTWWKQHYGNPGSGSGGLPVLSPNGASPNVPEPASIALAALGLFGQFFRVRRANLAAAGPVLSAA